MDVKISVICPCFNSARFIVKTLESIALQTKKPLELIISDDGSTDATREIVNDFILKHTDFPIQLIENLHGGPGFARNSAIKQAKGDWIAFIDSDDTWMPNKLALVSQVIYSNTSINLVCHSEKREHTNGNSTILDYGQWYEPTKTLFKQLYHRNFLSPSAVTCKRQLLLDAGLFDETLMSAQDYELWLRMASQIKPYFIRDILGSYFDRSESISATKAFRRLKNVILILIQFRNQASKGMLCYQLTRVIASASINACKSRFILLGFKV